MFLHRTAGIFIEYTGHQYMKKFLRNNGLSVIFLLLFFVSIVGQYITGWQEYNLEQIDHGGKVINAISYVSTGHFMSATFENWESEFLQMILFVVLTISLQQKGSSESKDFDQEEDVDREPDPKRKNAPWPVRKGGWILAIYKHSLSLSLLILFLLSFYLHLDGSLRDENHQLFLKGEPRHSLLDHMQSSRFWFESFQNWQSEFLSIFAIVLLSVYLREKGSPQSKPVDTPNSEK